MRRSIDRLVLVPATSIGTGRSRCCRLERLPPGYRICVSSTALYLGSWLTRNSAGSAPIPEANAPAAPAAAAPTGASAGTSSETAGTSATGAGAAGGQEEMARLLADWARSGVLTQGAADDGA
jgi:hypothetical protein